MHTNSNPQPSSRHAAPKRLKVLAYTALAGGLMGVSAASFAGISGGNGEPGEVFTWTASDVQANVTLARVVPATRSSVEAFSVLETEIQLQPIVEHACFVQD